MTGLFANVVDAIMARINAIDDDTVFLWGCFILPLVDSIICCLAVKDGAVVAGSMFVPMMFFYGIIAGIEHEAR